MATTLKTLLAILLVVTTLPSCKKEGPGGKASISGRILHHSLPITNATIYIKYGAQEFPGTDPSAYDVSVTAGTDGTYAFIELRKGNYYLFSIGYDSAISQTVKGGIPIRIKSKTENITSDIPVVE
ncbi:MAG: hypothetical protein HYX39_07250 [Bacteroidetes bacterium]|nr:hypothetical protein [Bacteroidota bacterium]